MKKVLLLVAVIAAFSFVSCKKDRTCTCTTTGSSTPDVYTITKVSASDAKNACLKTRTYTNGSSTSTTTCELK
jgi:hypothetical protein